MCACTHKNMNLIQCAKKGCGHKAVNMHAWAQINKDTNSVWYGGGENMQILRLAARGGRGNTQKGDVSLKGGRGEVQGPKIIPTPGGPV